MKSYLAQDCTTNSKKFDCYAIRNYGKSNGKTFIGGKEYVDWVCGLGSQLDGWYVNPAIQTKSSNDLAKTVCIRWGYDKCKITQSGSDACSCAVRIARTHTGKKWIYQSGYHGCHDWTVSNKYPSCRHIPKQFVKDFINPCQIYKELLSFNFNHNIAAVIIEPLQLDFGILPYLQNLKRECKRLGIILIFDEIITGLRVPTGTVATWMKVKPDLLVMGKAAGNGLPISWVLGSKKLMDNAEYFWSNTHAGNDYCCQIAEIMVNRITNEKIIKLWNSGNKIIKQIRAILYNYNLPIIFAGYNTRGEWQGEEKDLTNLWDLMGQRGHFLGRAWFLNYRHTSNIARKFLSDLNWSCRKINKGWKSKLDPVKFSFRRN